MLEGGMRAFLSVALFVLWGLIACGRGEAPEAAPTEKIEPTPMAAVEASPTHTKIPINTPIPTETMTTTSTRAPATAPTRRLTRNELVATRALLQTERVGATATPVFVNTPIAQPIAAPGLPEQPEPTAAPPLVEVEPTESAPPPVVEAPAGCINLNTASFEELQGIVHIGPERAWEIINMRPWTSVNRLTDVNGIGQIKLNEILNEGKACVQ